MYVVKLYVNELENEDNEAVNYVMVTNRIGSTNYTIAFTNLDSKLTQIKLQFCIPYDMVQNKLSTKPQLKYLSHDVTKQA